jgi:polyhydroxyalkanoate synthase subunit PhaC
VSAVSSFSSKGGDRLSALERAVAADLDPLGIVAPLVHAQLAWLTHPAQLAQAAARFTGDMLALQTHAYLRMLGFESADVIEAKADDNRFSDPEWTRSAAWDILKESYLLVTHYFHDCVYRTPGLPENERRRAAFWLRNFLNALAPTNFLWTNPVALRKAYETRGGSLLHGMQNLLRDIKVGSVSMVEPDAFEVGTNLATTPGKVVLRNRLLEVIHYVPTRPTNYEKPVVIVTPWINKYYVLDLKPEKSMVRFLLDEGYSVFITSWKNPTAEMRDVGFDDYVTDGVGAIVECARRWSCVENVHAVGYCIGGAALTTYVAWANRHYPAAEVPVATVTLLATLVDYEEVGDIEVFLDDGTLALLSSAMKQQGYLDGQAMASAFRLLRSNSLIWQYVVHDYLYGEALPAFDVLYWNMDTTRMPAAMHEWYLRELYVENRLVQKEALTVAGERIDLGAIVQPLYAVSAEEDHIAPWRSTFRVNAHVSGTRRFVLSSSGHILGIVNPVVTPPKREYWVRNASGSETPEAWRMRAEHRSGTWWEDWSAWLSPHSGARIAARPIDSNRYPVLADAPGTYVLES